MATEEVFGASSKSLFVTLQAFGQAFDEGIPLQEARKGLSLDILLARRRAIGVAACPGRSIQLLVSCLGRTSESEKE